MTMLPIRLVDVSVERDTPLHLLAALRDVQGAGTVELIHVGENRWWMGLVRPSAAMHMAALPMGQTPHGVMRSFKVRLQQQGFRFLGEYTDDQLSESYLRDELHFMLNRSEKDVERDFLAAVDKTDYARTHESTITASIMDRVQSEGRSIWAKAMRKRVMVGVNGFKGAH
jgi:hypothetical protein